MNMVFKKLGIHKMDEMEQQIAFKAQRNAYFVMVVALLGCSLYQSYKVYAYHAPINLLPTGLLILAVLVQSISQLLLQRRAVKDDAEYIATKPFLRIILLCLVIVAVIIFVGSAVVLLMVRP